MSSEWRTEGEGREEGEGEMPDRNDGETGDK